MTQWIPFNVICYIVDFVKTSMDIKEFLADFVADEQEKNTSPKDYEKMEKQEQQVILTLEMLDKFQFLQLEQICKEVCGRIPSPPRVYDKVINVEYEHHINRDDYTKFILKEMEFSEIKNFATKYNILK
ncbi:MAG: hypothetical protein COB91_02195 [Nitrosopumilales archaeon]|nr:MAG: hypothetical protein COB91_02195 [Nitrosopumilales archaeon]